MSCTLQCDACTQILIIRYVNMKMCRIICVLTCIKFWCTCTNSAQRYSPPIAHHPPSHPAPPILAQRTEYVPRCHAKNHAGDIPSRVVMAASAPRAGTVSRAGILRTRRRSSKPLGPLRALGAPSVIRAFPLFRGIKWAARGVLRLRVTLAWIAGWAGSFCFGRWVSVCR